MEPATACGSTLLTWRHLSDAHGVHPRGVHPRRLVSILNGEVEAADASTVTDAVTLALEELSTVCCL